MSVNKAILIGNVGKDPEVKHLEDGTAVAKFTLATSTTFKNKSGENTKSTEWHNIVAWRGLAEVCEKWIRKGNQIYVEGKIVNRMWDKDGTKKYFTEIVADNIRMLGGKKEGEAPQAAGSDDYQAIVEQAVDDNSNEPMGDDLPF
jgi:single-strand DNA-binding protein